MPFENEYLSKLEKWINKRRFTISQNEDSITVSVEIFTFQLFAVHRDDLEVLKEEFGQLQRMSRELEREVLLFNYAVFGTNSWSD